MAGLQIDPLDFAKIGQLMLDEGTFQGRQILTPEWVRESVRQGESPRKTGLLWWPMATWVKSEVTDKDLDIWRKGGADPAFVDKMATLRGKPISGDSELVAALDSVFGAGQGLQAYMMNIRAKGLPNPTLTRGPVVGYDANGYLGQYVAVVPASRLVAVRMIRQESFASDADNFGDFFQRVQELKPASATAK